jgi:ELWxxDGT repeat protein
LTAEGNRLFFTATDGVHGRELWRSDGTGAGTALVYDATPGPNGSGPSDLTDVGGKVFFTAHDGVHGRELWKSDGTRTGTMLVKDINAQPG